MTEKTYIPEWAMKAATDALNIDVWYEDGRSLLQESVAGAILQARSQAFEEIAAYVEGKDGKIPAAAIFAPLVSQNRMPDMSGDPRARLSPPRRREFDDATQALSQAIRQHSQKGEDNADDN